MTRAAKIHHARVLLQQARAFRLRGDRFSTVLLNWAGKARRAAMQPPVQPSLF